MGHYDSCREAEREIADEKSVQHMDRVFPQLSFDQKLAIKRAMTEFTRKFDKDVLVGSKQDHRLFEKMYEAFRQLT